MDYVKILKDSGLSNKKIADKLAVGEQTIRSYFRGDRSIPDSTKKLIDYEFGNKTLNEPTVNYSTSKNNVDELKNKIQAKDDLIVELKKNVNSLEKIVELLEGQNELLKFQLSVAKKNGT